MLYNKFRGNRPAGSGIEDFEGFLPYMGVEVICSVVPIIERGTVVLT